MSVNFHTVGNTYQPYGAGGADNVKNAPVSEEYLTIIKEFGLEDTAALRNAFAGNAPRGADMGSLLSMSNKLDGMSGSMADVFTVMLLIARMSQENKKTSQELRDVQQQGQLADMQLAADKIREAADFALAAGIVSGVMQIGSGAISIAGGLKGLSDLKGISSGAKPDVDVDTTSTTPSTTPSSKPSATTSPDLGLEKIRAQGRVFDGSGQVVGGLGSAISAGLTRASEEARAEEKEYDIQAKQHEMLAEKEADFMNFNKDMIQKVAQIMKDLIQLNTESEKAAATI